jgi:emfourin
MRISLVRSGGFAGLRLEATVDTSALDPEIAQRFHKLVEAADLFSLSEPTINVKSEPDRFRYTLTIDDKGREHSITFEERRVPEAVQPLFEAVWGGLGAGPGTKTA